jgi:putative multiple sugar transport system ATP-binding protein
MTDTILRMQDITKTFPGVRALQDVNLDVRPGEIHAICGENGAGKSTLMKVLSGVHAGGTSSADQTAQHGSSPSFRELSKAHENVLVFPKQKSPQAGCKRPKPAQYWGKRDTSW